MSNTGTFHHGSGGGAGKANFQDIIVTKYIDMASPNLMLSAPTASTSPRADHRAQGR